MAMPPKPLPAKPIRKPVVCSVVYTSGDEGMKAVVIRAGLEDHTDRLVYKLTLVDWFISSHW